jgi:transposase InsO family protein
MDATDTAAPETRYRGRSQTFLYNHTRPHSRLGWMSPATYAAARRSAALRYTDGSAQRTAATTAQQGIRSGQTLIAPG